MTSMRKLLCFLMAMMIAAFALPSVAGNDKKQYSLQMSVVAAPTPPPFFVKAVVTNEGNSTINSFRLFVTGLIVVGVDQPATGHATFDGSSVSVTNMHPLKSGDSLTVNLRVGSCGDGIWNAAVWTGSSLNGQNFTLVPADSNLMTPVSCGSIASGPFTVPTSINPACGVGGQRGIYDKDGSAPTGVPYYVTNTVPTNGQLHFRWPTNTGDIGFDQGLDPAAAFQYSICASGPLPGGPTLVAWLNTNGTPTSSLGTPAFIAAQDCIPPKILPAPYGRLVGSIGTGTLVITVNALAQADTIPHPLPPFDVVIATVNENNMIVGSERMTVTNVSSDENAAGDLSDPNERGEDEQELETWIVTRAVLYGTTPLTHPNNALVMSTPLPYLPANAGAPYIPTGGTGAKFVQAQMCISDRNSQPTSHSTTFIDIGDGWSTEP